MKVGDAAIVRFDGEDDHFRFTGGKDELKAFTAFVVVAPRRNLGGFRGFLALNAPNGRDYETGLTIDMGPNGTPRFTDLNVEGKGFGGWRNLMKPGGDFGKLYQLEVRGDGEDDSPRRRTAPPAASGRGPTRRCRSRRSPSARASTPTAPASRKSAAPRGATSPRCCSSTAR